MSTPRIPNYAAVENRIREFPNTRIYPGSLRLRQRSSGAGREHDCARCFSLSLSERVFAKLTLLPLASREPFPFLDVHWMVRELVDAFGPERCLFGTNFPQAQYSPHVSYEQVVSLFTDVIDLSPSEREWILGGTASGLWRWSLSPD